MIQHPYVDKLNTVRYI